MVHGINNSWDGLDYKHKEYAGHAEAIK